MRIRLVSAFGEGLPALQLMQRDGADVEVQYLDPRSQSACAGIVDMPKGLPVDLTWVDAPGTGLNAYGSGKLNDILEMDRPAYLKIAKGNGILVPQYVPCESKSTAMSHVSSCLWRITPLLGPAYCSLKPKTILEQKVFTADLPDTPLLLMEKKDGVPLLFGCFYHNGKPLLNTLHSAIELFRFCPDGPMTTGVAAMAWWWKDAAKKIGRSGPPVAKLWNSTLGKLGSFLERMQYTGCLTARLVIAREPKEHPAYLIELLGRPAFPVFQALLASTNAATFMEKVSSGAEPEVSENWNVVLRVSVPPFPGPGVATAVDRTVVPDNDFLPIDAYYGMDGTLKTAKSGPVTGDIVVSDSSVNRAMDEAEAKAHMIILLDKQWRQDFPEAFRAMLGKLQDWKYIRGIHQ